MKNRTLGVLGLGRIDRKMAQRRKKTFDMDIIITYHNPKPNKKAERR